MKLLPTAVLIFRGVNSGNEIYLFAYGGNCPACDAVPCPPYDYRTLRISPFALNLGEHTVYDNTTGEALFTFYVTGED